MVRGTPGGGGAPSRAAGVSHCQDATACARRERGGAVLAPPPVEFARRGSLHLAYQRPGGGPCALVFVAGAVATALRWEDQEPARNLRRMASFARLVTYDQQG